ncbi:MAG: hypothetical protein OXQ89_20230 [Rhodospirillaceae bacterium]|nr:hypothetical protein [Rhodospirillaceae bacterium]MDE0000078.1 hypothetical protein [Rhodospirillaceae bacterium]MDE0360634.1 hypothetical protein [Rhodospirillaceae bacterium]
MKVDTLDAARRLKAVGIKPEHAEAIAEVMGLYFNQPRRATAERFDAQTARRDAIQSTMLSESPARTDSARTARWWDCIDVEVGVVWFLTLTTILACAFTLLQFI